MQNKLYIPTRCFSCRYWALHEIKFIQKGANLICTHCNHSEFMEGTERKIKKLVSDVNRVFPFLAAHEPALQALENPGDFVSLSKRSSK